MKKTTYYRLSPLGQRRAWVISHIETWLFLLAGFALGILTAWALGVIFRVMGWS